MKSSPSVGDGDHDAAARLDLLDLADHLVVDPVLRRDGDDGHVLVDQGDGPVLHLAGRVALCVDVADLLELERAFEGDGEVDATAQVEEVGVLEEGLRQLLVDPGVGRVEHAGRPGPAGAARSSSKRAPLLRRERAAHACPDWTASRYWSTIEAVKALVEATPISGPVCM